MEQGFPLFETSQENGDQKSRSPSLSAIQTVHQKVEQPNFNKEILFLFSYTVKAVLHPQGWLIHLKGVLKEKGLVTEGAYLQRHMTKI